MTDVTITVHYFARLREQLGTEQETVTIPANLTLAELKQRLAQRGAPWQLLTGERPVLAAVNQAMAKNATPLQDRDEVAFFPPVTGG